LAAHFSLKKTNRDSDFEKQRKAGIMVNIINREVMPRSETLTFTVRARKIKNNTEII